MRNHSLKLKIMPFLLLVAGIDGFYVAWYWNFMFCIP